MTTEQLDKLYTIFRTLPEDAKDWFNSDEAAAKTADIAREFVLSEAQEGALPLLVLRLITQNITRQALPAALAEAANLDRQTAERVAAALVERVVGPALPALRFAGITLNETAPAPAAPPMPPPMPAPTPQQPTANETAPQPFMLHEEASAEQPSAETAAAPFVFAPKTAAEPERKPITVVIERVVHYSHHTTPLHKPNPHKNPMRRPFSRWLA
jgi:hypothetical protein